MLNAVSFTLVNLVKSGFVLKYIIPLALNSDLMLSDTFGLSASINSLIYSGNSVFGIDSFLFQNNVFPVEDTGECC